MTVLGLMNALGLILLNFVNSDQLRVQIRALCGLALYHMLWARQCSGHTLRLNTPTFFKLP